jgi:hypothetical protein
LTASREEKDPVRVERAKKAWETRRANQLRRQAEEVDLAPAEAVTDPTPEPTPAVEPVAASSGSEVGPPPLPPRPDDGKPGAARLPTDVEPEPEPVIPKADPATAKGEVVQIHILNDGFTAFAKIWYQGETISVERGSPEWQQTVDKTGRSWLDMSVEEQLARYDGVQQFGFGPWPGQPAMTQEEYEKAIAAALSPEEERRIEKKRQREQSAPLPVTSGR